MLSGLAQLLCSSAHHWERLHWLCECIIPDLILTQPLGTSYEYSESLDNNFEHAWNFISPPYLIRDFRCKHLTRKMWTRLFGRRGGGIHFTTQHDGNIWSSINYDLNGQAVLWSERKEWVHFQSCHPLFGCFSSPHDIVFFYLFLTTNSDSLHLNNGSLCWEQEQNRVLWKGCWLRPGDCTMKASSRDTPPCPNLFCLSLTKD